jgi:hypothetical protein
MGFQLQRGTMSQFNSSTDDIIVEFRAGEDESPPESENFMILPRLEKAVREMEDILGLFRDGKLKEDPPYITSFILESIETIKSIIAGIEAVEQSRE